MICSCALLDIVRHPAGDRLTIIISKGMATVRPVGVTVRIEHLDCMSCIGVQFRPGPSDGLVGDCGCSNTNPVVATYPDPVSEPPSSRGGSCACGQMSWEDARDGALILDGFGYYYVWDRAPDGAVVVRGGHCVKCGKFEVETGELAPV